MKRLRILLLATSCALALFSVLMMLRSRSICDSITISCGGNRFLDIRFYDTGPTFTLIRGLQGWTGPSWRTSSASNPDGTMLNMTLNNRAYGSSRAFLGVEVSQSSRAWFNTHGSMARVSWAGWIAVDWWLAAALFAIAPTFWILRRQIRRLRPPADPDARPCEVCGYDLRAQEVPRCPECGTPFGVDRKRDRKKGLAGVLLRR
jgi:hypothetical protein